MSRMSPSKYSSETQLSTDDQSSFVGGGESQTGAGIGSDDQTLRLPGRIVPEPVERYLAHLNHLSTPLLLDVADTGRTQQLPLIDAEVGALLHVLALAS